VPMPCGHVPWLTQDFGVSHYREEGSSLGASLCVSWGRATAMYTNPTVRTIMNMQQRRRGEKMRPHMDGSARRKCPGAPCGTTGSHDQCNNGASSRSDGVLLAPVVREPC